MKNGMCNGCDHLKQKPSKRHNWEVLPFCRERDLHIDYIEKMNPDEEICEVYRKGGIS